MNNKTIWSHWWVWGALFFIEAVAASETTSWPSALVQVATLISVGFSLYLNFRLQQSQLELHKSLVSVADQQELNHKLMNSRLTELQEATRTLAHAEGKLEEAKEERERVATNTLAVATAKSVLAAAPTYTLTAAGPAMDQLAVPEKSNLLEGLPP